MRSRPSCSRTSPSTLKMPGPSKMISALVTCFESQTSLSSVCAPFGSFKNPAKVLSTVAPEESTENSAKPSSSCACGTDRSLSEKCWHKPMQAPIVDRLSSRTVPSARVSLHLRVCGCCFKIMRMLAMSKRAGPSHRIGSATTSTSAKSPKKTIITASSRRFMTSTSSRSTRATWPADILSRDQSSIASISDQTDTSSPCRCMFCRSVADKPFPVPKGMRLTGICLPSSRENMPFTSSWKVPSPPSVTTAWKFASGSVIPR
mmetsp:Transcript_102000/g.243191  ORF Transcript_102000/g.243191 Transcript_102000/m.243191 type:complete len:261 (+) Transcript_102000:1484-2266(+)